MEGKDDPEKGALRELLKKEHLRIAFKNGIFKACPRKKKKN